MKRYTNKQVLKMEQEALKNKDSLPLIKGFLTKQEVANKLNVSVQFVSKLVKEKKLKPLKDGLFSKIKVNAFYKKMKKSQSEALDKLAEETKKLNLDDDFPW